jgi:hypothetical protein
VGAHEVNKDSILNAVRDFGREHGRCGTAKASPSSS